MRLATLQILIAIVGFGPSIAWSGSATLTASKDNSIFFDNPNNSNGGGAGIFVGSTNVMQGSSPRRGLLEFDVAGAVPTGATITNVELSMYLGMAPQNVPTQIIDLHRLTSDWGEGTAGDFTTSISGTGTGSPATAGDATWNQRHYQQTNWTAPGAVGNFVDEISGSQVISSVVDTQFVWFSTPTMVNDVQGWLDHTLPNDGWILINEGESVNQSVKAFYSRNATRKNSADVDMPPGWTPTLNVTYVNGDYNGNGSVDAADYVVWRKTFGQSASPAGNGADGSPDNTIDDSDYTYWRAHYGNPSNGLAISVMLPEPATAIMLLSAGPWAFFRKRR